MGISDNLFTIDPDQSNHYMKNMLYLISSHTNYVKVSVIELLYP